MEMGDGADLALECAFRDEEEHHRLKYLSSSERYDAGIIDEQGNTIEEPCSLPIEGQRKIIKQDMVCPVCGFMMVQRINWKLNIPFWGCSQFPHCKGNRNW